MRALLIVLDSVGCGGAPDAAQYGDEGANTLGHIFERIPDLLLPNLDSLGLRQIVDCSKQAKPNERPIASYGRMRERSVGKDTTTGHWELAGVILDHPFATFDRFPDELVHAIERAAGVKFIGNYAGSGTTILEELGPEHVKTGKPILYTSADSVMQIAAHEDVIPISRLYEICKTAREHADAYRIGRIIARPFDGAPGHFNRTARRHDYSMKPPRTMLSALRDNGTDVVGIGKIGDIFAGEGITESLPTASNADGMERILEQWHGAENRLVFANLVDFDMLFGHRRDVQGYARALREFDAWLPQLLQLQHDDDMIIITADHGNDPAFRGTDHTREEVPLFVLHKGRCDNLGTRKTYADVAASIAQHFGVNWPTGTSFLA